LGFDILALDLPEGAQVVSLLYFLGVFLDGLFQGFGVFGR
jgi:hypothetical protein